MTRLAPLALLAACAAVPAAAQSQLGQDIVADLRRAGVPDGCIVALSSHDFAVLKGIQDNPDISSGQKRLRLKQRAEKGCGGAPSFLRDILSPKG